MMLVDDVALGDGGVVEMPNDSPLMENTLMVPCMDDDDLMYMMMLDLLDDGALEFDDGPGAMSIIMPMMEMTCDDEPC